MIAKIIKYIDSYYLYTPTYSTSIFRIHEACGYVSKDGQSVRVEFVRQIRPRFDGIVRGLLIPPSLIHKGNKKQKKTSLECDAKQGDKILVKWEDVTLVSYSKRRKCSLIKTVGVLEDVDSQRLIVSNPTTTKRYRNSRIEHPKKRPTFYVIPISVIKIIKKMQ